jgi:ABC-type phosphate/phosphonate transport system permease subunit
VTVGGLFCGILLRRTMMKTAFGILALYLSIPLAIVAAQSVVAHQAAQQPSTAHVAVAQVVPAAIVVARH